MVLEDGFGFIIGAVEEFFNLDVNFLGGALAAITLEGTITAAQEHAVRPLSATDERHNNLIVGYSGGLGIDVSLTAGLFMRAEWEYARYTTVVDTSINTVRAGLGYKF